MGQPLDGMPTGGRGKQSVRRALRNRLAVTTILAVAPFLSYGRQAYAACEPAAAPLTHLCTDASPGQLLFVDNANFATGTPPYVTTGGLAIEGGGNQRFTDEQAATSITNSSYYGRGLSVVSTGDIGDTPGAVTITTNGTISGTAHGIYARNEGDGDITITANGSVTGTDFGGDTYVKNDGIYAKNFGANLTVTTGVGSAITGEHNGIDARNYGSGDLTITTNGEVTGDKFDAIYAVNSGDALSVTVNAQSVVKGFGYGIGATNNGSGDLTIKVDGSVTSEGYDGIHARNEGANLIITTAVGSSVRGEGPHPESEDEDSNGIDAVNEGSGYLKITADGEVFGNFNDGIYAKNEGTDLIIETGAQSVVKGGGNGIGAYNYGSGNLRIDAQGVVGGYSYAGDGIKAYNSAAGGYLNIVTGTQAVTGGDDGIQAENLGDGDLTITTNGAVTGKNGNGITAINNGDEFYNTETEEWDPAFGRNLTITTNAAVTGKFYGIDALNRGTGDLTITANGNVTGQQEDGIYAYNSQIAKGASVTTGAAASITGKIDGIDVRNYGDGDLAITANGNVTGQDGNGIFARNVEEYLYLGGDQGVEGRARGLTITTGPASVVTGELNGIYAQDTGVGDFEITVNGRVTGETGDGIYAFDGSEGYDSQILDVNEDGYHFSIFTSAASIVTGRIHGINAINDGNGDLNIEANGQVTGTYGDGIHAAGIPFGVQDLTIGTGAGSVITGGGGDGIDARQESGGAFKITVGGTVSGLGDICIDSKDDCKDEPGFGINSSNRYGDSTEIEIGGAGLVQGVTAGIYAESWHGQLITITNDGIVRNLSTRSADYAIRTTGGATDIKNTGAVIGTARLSSFNDTFTNDGLWSMTGVSDFGLGEEDEVNNGGVLIAAVTQGTPENPVLTGLERFNNSGAVSLVDGAAEDTLEITGVLAGETEYKSEGGLLGVDAILGPDGKADQLQISGNVTGQTRVHVNVVGSTGFNDEGIALVRVFSGTTGDGDFVLDGPLNAGFYTWDMRYNGTLNQHELFSSGVGIGAEEFGAGMTATQDLWFQTLGTVLGRQVDLRSLIGGTNVTPVADFAEPVSPTPVARVTPGFWVSGLGAYLKRDDEQDGFTLDRTQTIWGGLAGFDFGTQDVGDALLFGVFGGYMSSKLKFDETDTEWNYEGPTVGVYATYLDRAFFVDVTVKADFLDIEIDPEDLAPDADDGDTDALNIGGRIDTGYKFGEAVFVEPQASFAVVHSEIDDVDVFGGTVAFDDETSVRGRLGLRLGFDHQAADATIFTGDVIASVWEDFSGDNNATIADPALPSFGVSDDPGSTMGDVSIGFGVAAPEGWSGFLRGNYQFAEDYDAYSGNAGLRYSW